jgi:hypothetical protein
MSIRSLIKDIRLAANSSTARDRQYRDSVFDLTFNKITTIDECFASIEDAILNVRNGEQLLATERNILENAVEQAFRNVYTPRNIKNIHKKYGYKIFAHPNQHEGESALANYVGYRQRGVGGMKLAVYLRQGMLTANSLGPTVTYAGSMQIGSKGTQNRQVINALWYTMVREALRLARKTAGVKVPKTGQKGYGAKNIGSVSNSSRALRLHGPTASQNVYGSTGEVNDTSVPVVSLVEQLKDIKAEGMQLPEGVTSQLIYNKAFNDIIAELDNEFIINSETISSIVNADKIIRIQIHQGGDQHQGYMAHADSRSVNRIIDSIEDKLLNSPLGLSSENYRASKSMSDMAKDAALAQVVTNFVTKSGKPDMRYKVNKRAALQNVKPRKKSNKGKFSNKTKGTRIATGMIAGKSKAKKAGVSRKVQNQKSALGLKELINAALPEAMLLKMHPPALRNRTGRFRNSAEVTNVTMGPRGGTQIDYTYMKDPYQTFEPGGAMGSVNRDPRRLIGGTVREIAQQITGNKFITTRRR